MTSADAGARGGAGIVHLGLGAFHRAHQAVYTQDANDATGGTWRITGVSLHSTETVRGMNRQAGRYTLVTRGRDGTSYRPISVHDAALSGARRVDRIVAALAAPETRIITLTVTEKGYRPEPGRQQTMVVGLLARALAARRQADRPPVTVLACDNLPGNGRLLRELVLDSAQRRDSGLARWIADHVRFPSTMVDRITPATTRALIDEVAAATGVSDAIPVETESFSQWVIEDDFAGDRPAWDRADARLVADVAPYETLKLRMLNGAHSMLAYMGVVAGLRLVRDVMADPVMSRLVARHMTAAAATLSSAGTLGWQGYRDDLLVRFSNPAIAHATGQIAMDGSRKMPLRVFSACLDAAGRDQDLGPFAFATAAWARFLTGRTDSGAAFALQDPRADALLALPAAPRQRIEALCALPELLPPALAARRDFVDLTVAKLATMTTAGMHAAAAQEAAGG